jgi:hypothetical protein
MLDDSTGTLQAQYYLQTNEEDTHYWAAISTPDEVPAYLEITSVSSLSINIIFHHHSFSQSKHLHFHYWDPQNVQVTEISEYFKNKPCKRPTSNLLPSP